LQKAGIRCRVVGDYLSAGLGDIPGIRTEIWVHQKDLVLARAVLREHREAGSQDETESEEGGEEF
jgi:hypothetical protein